MQCNAHTERDAGSIGNSQSHPVSDSVINTDGDPLGNPDAEPDHNPGSDRDPDVDPERHPHTDAVSDTGVSGDRRR